MKQSRGSGWRRWAVRGSLLGCGLLLVEKVRLNHVAPEGRVRAELVHWVGLRIPDRNRHYWVFRMTPPSRGRLRTGLPGQPRHPHPRATRASPQTVRLVAPAPVADGKPIRVSPRTVSVSMWTGELRLWSAHQEPEEVAHGLLSLKGGRFTRLTAGAAPSCGHRLDLDPAPGSQDGGMTASNPRSRLPDSPSRNGDHTVLAGVDLIVPEVTWTGPGTIITGAAAACPLSNRERPGRRSGARRCTRSCPSGSRRERIRLRRPRRPSDPWCSRLR